MVLHYIWVVFFLLAFGVALIRLLFFGDMEIFPQLMQGIFGAARTGFEISLGLTGVLTLWMGIMKIGENGGIVPVLMKLFGPFLRKLFPSLPKDHPAFGSIVMNITSNMLGLDNAATPLGLKAMKEMQEVNPHKDTASDAQIMFLVINTACLILLPINVMVYRSQLGAADPSDIFIPIMLSSFVAVLTGIIAVAIMQRIRLLDKVMIAYMGSFILCVAAVVYMLFHSDKTRVAVMSKLISNVLLFVIIIMFILLAVRKKINIYDAFIDGAKEGFGIAVKIIPFLVAMLIAISVLRSSGILDYLVRVLGTMLAWAGINADFVPALPTALMKPLTGSGARAMMIETMQIYGADSFAGRVASVIQGTTDTTFYIIAVYFGSVGIKKIRYAVSCGLLADLAGFIAAVCFSYLFFAQ